MALVQLNSETSSVVVHAYPAPTILYWGARLNSDITEEHLSALATAVPQSHLESPIPLTLFMEPGRGLFSSPGIAGHRDGQDWSPVFRTTDIEPLPSGVKFVCDDKVAGLTLCAELYLDKLSNVLKIRHTLINSGEGEYRVERLALTLPVPARGKDTLTFHGRWAKEFQLTRQLLEHGALVHDNRRGRTSHEAFPGMMMGVPGFSEQQGEIWACHLGWSGNHHLRAEVQSDGRRFIQAGALYNSGEITLASGESLATPWLYGTYSNGGLNDISFNFHRYVRNNLLTFPGNKPRPVHLNTWEGIYFDHNPDYLKQMATQAAALGVERFIIDDGWFRGRTHERAALGDWYLDEEKYPDGLEPVIEHVNQQGMEFGLWFEPEMINPDSDLYRQHPAWVLALPGYEQPTGRWQYVLDLQNPDVCNYLLDRISAILSHYAIDYIKWDMNRELVQPAHQGRPAVHGQTHAYYRLLDTLRERHPHVDIESCASGGGRIDFEVLTRTQRFWASDNNDALERQRIQQGFSYFFPPEVMGAHIGNAECHVTRRRHSLAFRGLTALFGHMGVELDPVKADAQQQQGFARYIALHKQLRPLLHSGRFFRIDTSDHNTLAYGVTDTHSAVVLIAQLGMPEHSLPGCLQIPYLEAEGAYRIRVLDWTESPNLMKQPPQWMKEQLVLTGEFLKQVGLTLPILDPESALLIRVDRG